MRPSTDADMNFARDVHHAAYNEVVIRQFGAWNETEQDQRFLEDWKAASFQIILLDETPCGYAAVEDRTDDIHVRELVIHPAYQEKGIGSSFLRSIMSRAIARGVPVRLGTFSENREALRFYKRLGFEQIGETGESIFLEWNAQGNLKAV